MKDAKLPPHDRHSETAIKYFQDYFSPEVETYEEWSQIKTFLVIAAKKVWCSKILCSFATNIFLFAAANKFIKKIRSMILNNWQRLQKSQQKVSNKVIKIRSCKQKFSLLSAPIPIVKFCFLKIILKKKEQTSNDTWRN